MHKDLDIWKLGISLEEGLKIIAGSSKEEWMKRKSEREKGRKGEREMETLCL